MSEQEDRRKVVSVRLGPKIVEALDEMGRREGHSRGFYLRLALELALPAMQRTSEQRSQIELSDVEDEIGERLFALWTLSPSSGQMQD